MYQCVRFKFAWLSCIKFLLIFACLIRYSPATADSNHLKVGLYDNPPKLYLDNEKGPKGIFPGIINHIAKKEGWQVQYTHLSFKEGLRRLEDGTLDIMQDVAWSEKRSRVYSFTNETVMVSWGRVYQTKGSNISTLIDLRDKRIAYMDGGIYSDGPDGLKTLMKKFELKADFIPAANYKQVFEYLDAGKADAGVVNRLFGRTNKQRYNIETTPILISPISIRLAFSKSNPATPQLVHAFDKHLAHLKADVNSVYYKLMDEYIGEPRKVTLPFLKALLAVLVILVAFFALLGIFLNLQSRKKSIQLENRDKALKKSEQEILKKETRFKEMARLLPCGILETDYRLNIIYINKIGVELFGYTQADIDTGLNFGELFAYGLPEKLALTAAPETNPGKNIFISEEFLLKQKDGSGITALLNINSINEDHQFMGFRASIADLTELKKLQKETIRSQKLESTGILAGGIAHDFNNILLGVFGNIGLAKLELSPDQNAHKLIEEAEKSMSQAKDLTAQLLTFAKGGDPIKQAITIDEIIKETVSFNLSGSNIKFEMEKSEDLWQVNADKGQISQVISNLVINARQAMAGGGRLRIKLENTGLPEKEFSSLQLDRYVQITITDEGCGINDRDLENIFDPYFTTKEDGSGLGLSIVHSIILKHHGYIYVSSSNSEGTTFVIYLPAAPADERPSVSHVIHNEPDMANHIMKILLMDDDLLVQEVSKKILNKLGHQVVLCENGSQAVELYHEALTQGSAYHLVILDLTIPGGMGGREAIEELVKIDPDVSAVVASGYSNDPVMANFQEYGFKAMLTKPYTLDKMEKVITQTVSY